MKRYIKSYASIGTEYVKDGETYRVVDSELWNGKRYYDSTCISDTSKPEDRVREGEILYYQKNNGSTPVDDFPQCIEVFKRNKWIPYEKRYMYISDDGEKCCSYVSNDSYDIVTSYISLYPDGHLTFLWNGYDQPYDAEWRVVQ